MRRRFFSGSTLDQVVMMAARHYGIAPEELAYHRIEKRHGFLRTRKAVMIAVDPDRPSRGRAQAEAGPESAAAPGGTARPAAAELVTEAPAPLAAADVVTEAPAPPATAPAPAEPSAIEHHPGAPAEIRAEDRELQAEAVDEPTAAAPVAAPRRSEPRETEHDEDLLAAAERATRTLLRFAGIDGEASATSGDERIEVEVEGPDDSLLVVENGKGLLAIQHLLPRMLRGLTGKSSFVRVDSRGFHRQRKERIEALAHKEAEAVSRDGGSRTLPPMAPDERRLVHLALKDVPAVVTESRGTGLHKRVVIRPAPGDGGRHDIEARHGF